jgi:hypothetical protein
MRIAKFTSVNWRPFRWDCTYISAGWVHLDNCITCPCSPGYAYAAKATVYYGGSAEHAEDLFFYN